MYHHNAPFRDQTKGTSSLAEPHIEQPTLHIQVALTSAVRQDGQHVCGLMMESRVAAQWFEDHLIHLHSRAFESAVATSQTLLCALLELSILNTRALNATNACTQFLWKQ